VDAAKLRFGALWDKGNEQTTGSAGGFKKTAYSGNALTHMRIELRRPYWRGAAN
jgi:hypothetical protein